MVDLNQSGKNTNSQLEIKEGDGRDKIEGIETDNRVRH